MSDESITFTGDYSTYEAALADCEGDLGYESNNAIDRYVRRYNEVTSDLAGTFASPNVREQTLRFMAALSVAEPIDGIYEVYDYGGGYGAIYELFRFIYPARQFRWTVVEVPALVARAGELGASDEKLFVSELPRRPYSLGIASGTLQYLPNPAAAWDDLRAIEVGAMFVNRIPIAPFLTRDRLTVQSVPPAYFKAKFPAWFFAPDWVDRLTGFGRLIAQWDSPGDTVHLDEHTFCDQALLLVR